MTDWIKTTNQQQYSRNLINDFLFWLGGLGNRPTDPPDARLRKAILIYFCAFTLLLGVIWGGLYFWLGSVSSGWIPLGYSLASFLNLAYFALRKELVFFRFAQLFMVLMLPALLQWNLGGYGPASAVIIWSLAAPIGALMLVSPAGARPWFWAFLILVIVSGLLDPALNERAVNVPKTIRVIFYVMNVGVPSLVMYFMLQHFTIQREAAQRRSEELLLNILPEPIAERLKEGAETIADDYNEVTVLFADIVGFTEMSADVDATEVVRMLNDVFSDFDMLAEKYNLEKIKTIGDAYMVAGGLPEPQPDHAEAVMKMALDMLDVLEEKHTWNGNPVQLRIGINTGPVVAGVIGRQKFIYDLWGDAVNTASRMESSGLSNVIQVTAHTYEKLKDQYSFTEREPVYVKGKGEMVTYLLER